MEIAITIDIEKDLGYHDSYLGIDEGLPLVLDILNQNRLRATFFVSGETAHYLNQKGALREIVMRGHEVGSHGFRHTDYRRWSFEKIREEICTSKSVIEDLSGISVKGYRAPQFLVSEKVIRAVGECGFRYDSSLPDPSGISAARVLRHVGTGDEIIRTIRQAGLQEFPIGSLPVLKIPHGLLWINLAGLGTYQRLFNRMRHDFLIFYLHGFDLVRQKNRLRLDLMRKVFYLKNQDGIGELFRELIEFWTMRGVTFVRLDERLTSLHLSP